MFTNVYSCAFIICCTIINSNCIDTLHYYFTVIKYLRVSESPANINLSEKSITYFLHKYFCIESLY